MQYNLITISGQLGSGKSTVAKMLASQLGWQYYSTGMAQRKIAQQRGITTLELNQLALTHPEIDHEIDRVFQDKCWQEQNYVVDSRLAWHFLPHAFKIHFTVQPKYAAQRIYQQNRTTEKYASVAEAEEFLQKRTQSERQHFMKNYHIDVTNEKNYDLIIDTTYLSPQQVCDKILEVMNS